MIDRARVVAALSAVLYVVFAPNLVGLPAVVPAPAPSPPPPRARVSLLSLVPVTASDAALAAARARAFSGAGGGMTSALAFAVTASAAPAFAPLASGAVAVLPVDCPDADAPPTQWAFAPRVESAATCRLFAGLCAALRAYEPDYVAVLRPDAVVRRFAEAAPPAHAASGAVWGSIVEGMEVDGAGYAWYPKPHWPRHARSGAFVLSANVAEGLCAMHSATVPLKLFGPAEAFLGVALSSWEGVLFIDRSVGEVRGGVCPPTDFAVGLGEADFGRCGG